MVIVYRGVLLYGESGAGKSSLVNAGLIPAAASEGFRADRVRVQPRRGEELVVERIPMTEGGSSFLPSSFASAGEGSSQIVLPVDELRARLAALSEEEHRPLLIFDQFEELITLFEEAPEGKALEEALAHQQRIVDVLVEVMRDETLPVKLLFAFREDYLAKVKKLLARCPELVGQSLWLSPPGTDALTRIIRGPFEDHPGAFDPELSPELAKRLSESPELPKSSGAISLSEVQIVCLRLWESPDPDALLKKRRVPGLLEDYLKESLESFPEELRYPAVALLSHMVTGSGVRNVIAAEDLFERVRKDEPDIPAERLGRTLDALEKETKLVRRELRRDLNLYEIASEFLVPWIRGRREEFVRLQARQRERRRLLALSSAIGLLVAVALAVGSLAVWALQQRSVAQSRSLAARAFTQLEIDPASSVKLAAKAAGIHQTDEAEDALRAALAESHVRTVLVGHTDSISTAAFSPDGTRVVTASQDKTARIWRASSGARPVVLRGHKAPVSTAAFSPNGKLVVTAGADGTVRIWQASSGRRLAVLRTPALPVSAASFSPDGKYVVTASDDRTVRIYACLLCGSLKELLDLAARVPGTA